jgi:hypothetical protein
VSLKRFGGWEPETVTEYEYDGDRLVRTVTRVTEPEWDPEQQAHMIALTVWQAGRCPGCGEQFAESTSSLNDPDNRDGTGYYEVPPPTRCHACTAKHTAEEAFRKDSDRPHSVYFQPVLRPRKPR